ncbi:uncharacterized protein MONBRDRAFT_23720 [Monosiga brevicollis MX1]|uniref:RING-type domain-containing protein n=1 Tax=Monosiga brevicollis TaxID=81824 RepID=A9UU90_MONBE|nr:uncharacterized protein MONBRDRAFT_23720 [Monosiga brevicollis MX1]EDQ91380.1 predicted protein [Monosiga brevicollis MX1]|eukprot:XP_001743802.1 hypothetical protein [Monosiga brevicollis MX1]
MAATSPPSMMATPEPDERRLMSALLQRMQKDLVFELRVITHQQPVKGEQKQRARRRIERFLLRQLGEEPVSESSYSSSSTATSGQVPTGDPSSDTSGHDWIVTPLHDDDGDGEEASMMADEELLSEEEVDEEDTTGLYEPRREVATDTAIAAAQLNQENPIHHLVGYDGSGASTTDPEPAAAENVEDAGAIESGAASAEDDVLIAAPTPREERAQRLAELDLLRQRGGLVRALLQRPNFVSAISNSLAQPAGSTRVPGPRPQANHRAADAEVSVEPEQRPDASPLPLRRIVLSQSDAWDSDASDAEAEPEAFTQPASQAAANPQPMSNQPRAQSPPEGEPSVRAPMPPRIMRLNAPLFNANVRPQRETVEGGGNMSSEELQRALYRRRQQRHRDRAAQAAQAPSPAQTPQRPAQDQTQAPLHAASPAAGIPDHVHAHAPQGHVHAHPHAHPHAPTHVQTEGATPVPPPVSSSSASMAATIADLQAQVAALTDLMQASLRLQADVRRCVRQEVSSALARVGDPTSLQFERPAVRGAAHGSNCVVCMEESADTIMYRCGHLCACLSCATALMPASQVLTCPNLAALYHQERELSCPVCRSPILDIMQVYLP